MPSNAQNSRVGRGLLWFCLFGGAIAWTFHLMFAYAIAEFGCMGRLSEHDYLGITLVAWLELALTVASTAIASAATAVAYCVHHRLQEQENADAETAIMRNTAWAGLLTSGTFTFIILFESIPILYYLKSC